MNNYIYAFDLKDAEKRIEPMKDKYKNIIGIETEWGEKLLSDATPEAIDIGHHGKLQGNEPPSARWDLYKKYADDTLFVFSHFDLDSIYGCWILEGGIPDNELTRGVSKLIAWADEKGSHRAHQIGELYTKYNYVLKNLAYQLSNLKKNKADAADFVTQLHKYFIENYIEKDFVKTCSQDADAVDFKKYGNEEAYNALDKLLSVHNLLHVFISYKNFLGYYTVESFRHNYQSMSKVNIQYNDKLGKISIGVYDEETAVKLFGEKGVEGYIQEQFGNEAGGRLTVGGSPKNQKVEYSKFIKIVRDLKKRLREIYG